MSATSIGATTGSTRPAPAADRLPTDSVRSPLELLERAAVLAAARLAEHPFVTPAADLALRSQILATRTYRRATMLLWHACGVATLDELNVVGEHLASLAYRLPAAHRDAGSGSR
jgi:hypothetical protein